MGIEYTLSAGHVWFDFSLVLFHQGEREQHQSDQSLPSISYHTAANVGKFKVGKTHCPDTTAQW